MCIFMLIKLGGPRIRFGALMIVFLLIVIDRMIILVYDYNTILMLRLKLVSGLFETVEIVWKAEHGKCYDLKNSPSDA